MTRAERLRRATVAPGVSLPYLEQGAASTTAAVLIHGLGDSLRSYEPVLAHLPATVRALAPSLRGHGDADRPAAGYTSADHVDDIAALLVASGVERGVLAGHSSGSQIAQLFAITHPEQTAGLVLIGAPGPRPDLAATARMSAEIAALSDPIDETWLRGFADTTISGPVPPAFLDVLLEESRKVPARVYQAMWPGIRDFDISESLGRIAAPTLIVWGDHDRVPVATRAAQQTLVDAIPDARLVVYEGAGHSPHLEQPERFANDLVAFDRILRPGAID